ncbi:hypothetical protein [Sphingomonas adhaesiva]|uniref:hypothetical protein n=1 Tax=Sphingomonas adhaesiva TaxID=28212 RepID=UPI001471CC58|nr:hypothetical protein [Sphingomonas adhaesiva]
MPPRLHELGEYRFQRLVTDLHALEPNVATSSEYGVRGQADFGADVIARRTRGDGVEIASCKCYETTSASQVRAWSDEFLEHWEEQWRHQDVRRFVLATTAANVASRTVQDQVTAERTRFTELGVEYEAWGPTTLVAKIRPQRAIAIAYLGEFWANRICGPLPEPALSTAPATALVSAALMRQLAELQQRLSAQAIEAADRGLADLRSGRTGAVRAFIAEQRREDSWDQLDSAAQARVLRLAASLAIRDGDLDEAEALSTRADALAAQEEPRLAAQLALERSGPEAALTVLGEVSSVAGLQLRIALLVMTGDPPSAESELTRLVAADPDDPETMRMQALVALASDRREEALEHIRRAEAAAPAWTAVRQLGAMVRYAMALSPALPPEWFMAPNAFDSTFVREDGQSQNALEEALALIDLVVDAEREAIHHQVWRLAILSGIRARRDRARDEAASLLPASGHDPTVVAWCIYRGIDVDLGPSEAVLTERYEIGTDAGTARVLGMLLARRDEAAAVATLRASLERQTGDARSEAEEWIARLDPGASTLEEADDPTGAALAHARASGDWTPAANVLDGLLAPCRPDPRALPFAEAIAGSGRLELLAPRAERLLAFQTSTAVRLVVHARLRAGDPAGALATIDEHAGAFGEALPPDMRRLRAEALSRTGNIPAALLEADRIAGSGQTADRLFRAEIAYSTGNVRAAIPAVREALEAGILEGGRAWQWSRAVQTEEPALARRLLERAVATGIEDRFVAAALHDAMGLRLDAEAAALMSRVHERASDPEAPDVRILTIDELPALMAQQQAQAAEVHAMYLDGAIPVHLRFPTDPVEFALLHLGPNRYDGAPTRPWPIRHGGRPAAVVYDLPWSAWRPVMDVTALLVAARLDLLDAVEGGAGGIAVPASTPMVLLAMETGCRARSDATLVERILGAGILPAGIDEAASIRVLAPGDDDGDQDAGIAPSATLQALIASLAARNALTAEQAAATLDGLPPATNGAVPADGSPLLLETEALRRLASTDTLGTLAARYELRCDGALLDQATSAREAAAVALGAAQTLANLRQRLATGLETGTYRFLPQATDNDRDDEPDAADQTDTPLTRCLHDVITAPAAEGGMAWIDDRLVTGYARTGSMPVVGVADVLNALRREGRIDAARQERALDELRAAGALFMAPDVDEVTRALAAASSQGQHLVETPALAVHRRAIAAAALHERHLAIGEPRPDRERPDEVVPMQTAMRLLSNCLKDVWVDRVLDFEERVARSDWLWQNARRTRVGRVIAGEDQTVAQGAFEIIQVAHLLDQAVDVGGLRDERRSERLQYLQWVWLRAVEPMAGVDPTYVPRLGRYLADFYVEMSRSHEVRRPRDRRILKALLARRMKRLPDPIRAEVFRDPRMRPFGGIFERVTIGSANFEPEAFWREIRRTLLYGHGRLRASRNRGAARPVRLRRDGATVVLTGAVRAELSDPTLALSTLQGAARDAAIAAIVGDLRLDAASAERTMEMARSARTAAATAKVLREARDSSAMARLDEARTTLGRGRRMRLDVFAPAPLGAMLASMGLTDTSTPFAHALAEARRLRDSDAPRAGLAETAGVPVLRSAADAAKIATAATHARTPLALVHAIAAARAVGRPADEVAALAERLAGATERSGMLFTTLLRWTHRQALRDPTWRDAPPAYSLAAIWCHADRVLDVALAAGLDPEALRRSVEGYEPAVAAVDLLRLAPEGEPDVAWPTWVSQAALLHHGLAAAFGGEDPRPIVGDALADRLIEAQLSRFAGIVGPEARLLLRRDTWPNAMGSFLADSPGGLDGSSMDRPRIRTQLVRGALDAIEADPSIPDAWVQLGAFSAGGLDDDEAARLSSLLIADPARPARLVAAGLDPALWRTLLQPLAWRDRHEAGRLAVQIAFACRRLDQHRPTGGPAPVAPETAAPELVELASILSACAGTERERTFGDLLNAYADAWPAIVPLLHETVGNLTARTPSGRAEELWRAQNMLGAR